MVRVGAYIQIRNERLNFILENPNLKEVERPVFSSIQEQLGCIVTDAIVAYAVLDNTEKLDPRMDQLKRNFNDRLKKLLPKSENTDYAWWGITESPLKNVQLPNEKFKSLRTQKALLEFNKNWVYENKRDEVKAVRKHQAKDALFATGSGLLIAASAVGTFFTFGATAPLFALACAKGGRLLVKATGQAVMNALGFTDLANALLRSILFYLVTRCHFVNREVSDRVKKLLGKAQRLEKKDLEDLIKILQDEELWGSFEKHATRAKDGITKAINVVTGLDSVPMVVNTTLRQIHNQFEELCAKHILLGNFLHIQAKKYLEWKKRTNRTDVDILHRLEEKKFFCADLHKELTVNKALKKYENQKTWIENMEKLIKQLDEFSTTGKTELGVSIATNLTMFLASLGTEGGFSHASDAVNALEEVAHLFKETGHALEETAELTEMATQSDSGYDPTLQNNVMNYLTDPNNSNPFDCPFLHDAANDVHEWFKSFGELEGGWRTAA